MVNHDKKKTKVNHFSLLIAEDDEDDFLLTKEALKEADIRHKIHWVKDGEELMQFLDDYRPGNNGHNPVGMILLDLNMPKKDGREALREIKIHPEYRKIPVIIMTTSNAEADITHTYDLGVNSFIQKPIRFSELVEVIKILSTYWFKTVKLPL